jgi:uncharacterized protein (TIGR02145 family)
MTPSLIAGLISYASQIFLFLFKTNINIMKTLLTLFTSVLLTATAFGQDIELNGTVSAQNNQIKNVADPTDDQDAVTKSYTYSKAEVDAIIANLQSQINALQTNSGSSTVTDQDGNTYDYLTYGDQLWTVQDAEMVTYRDGTPIPQVSYLEQGTWPEETGAWCYYNDDPTERRIYNWYAITGIHDTDPNTPNKEFAPEGWHVPSYVEWFSLQDYLIANGYNYDGSSYACSPCSNEQNKIAKAMASTTGWVISSIDGAVGNNQSTNNSSGFNANPSTYVSNNEYTRVDFWTSSDLNSDGAWSIALTNSLDRVDNFPYNFLKVNFFSVRLVMDAEVDSNEIDNDSDGFTENQGDCNDSDASIYPGAAEIWDGIDNNCNGPIDEGFNETGSAIDYDGNSYNYLVYGTQVWTVENAEMVTYRDGTPIPEVTDPAEWENLTTGAWCYYDNDPTKQRLYNWYAVAGIHDTDPNTPNKEFAPAGWHVPSNAEWITFENYLIANGYNYDGTTTGNKIAKAMASVTSWDSSTNTGAVGNDQTLNNSSGFNGSPEGNRTSDGTTFTNEGNIAIFWSSTGNDSNLGWSRLLLSQTNYLLGYDRRKQGGYSVRFVRD